MRTEGKLVRPQILKVNEGIKYKDLKTKLQAYHGNLIPNNPQH